MRELLSQILEIIDYQGDKEAFSTKFLTIWQATILEILLTSLSDPDKKALIDQLHKELDLTKKTKIITDHFSLEQYQLAESQAMDRILQEYFQSIYFTLTEVQKEKLQILFSPVTSIK